MGIIAGGVPAAVITTASSLGVLSSSSTTAQANQESGRSQNSTISHQGDSTTALRPKSDLPSYITLEECYEISSEGTTNIKLIFCTNTKFYLYGTDKSVTKVKSVKVKSPSEIAVELEGRQLEKNKIFKVNEEGWKNVSRNEELNIDRTCEMHQKSDSTTEKVLICKKEMNHPIKLSKLNN